MLMRPTTVRVPKDVTCPSCSTVLLEEGEVARIEPDSLRDDAERWVEIVCRCEACDCPALVGYVPARTMLWEL